MFPIVEKKFHNSLWIDSRRFSGDEGLMTGHSDMLSSAPQQRGPGVWILARLRKVRKVCYEEALNP